MMIATSEVKDICTVCQTISNHTTIRLEPSKAGDSEESPGELTLPKGYASGSRQYIVIGWCFRAWTMKFDTTLPSLQHGQI